jgi:tRNA nucleotidyltransferase (CCA-adding enzyme)
MLQACASDARGRWGSEQEPYPQADYLMQLLAVARAIDAGEIARLCHDSGTIPMAVQSARINAIETIVKKKREELE